MQSWKDRVTTLMEFPEQVGLHFYTPGQGPMAWGKGPLGTNPALVLRSLRPEGLTEVQAWGSLVLSSIDVWLPHHLSPLGAVGILQTPSWRLPLL